MHDIAISPDGTGVPVFAGDVAIRAGRIAAVAGRPGPTRRAIGGGGHADDSGIRPSRLALAGR